MELYQKDQCFIAVTQYGEWAPKQAGFKWDAANRYWYTFSPMIAAQVGTFRPWEPPQAKPAPGDHWPTIREGRYAVTDPTDGTLKFYQVDKPQEGKWAGYTFLKVFASNERWPIKDRETKARILDAIAQDPDGCLARYGQELGICGVCGRTLTDEESRRLGIGPVCRGKFN